MTLISRLPKSQLISLAQNINIPYQNLSVKQLRTNIRNKFTSYSSYSARGLTDSLVRSEYKRSLRREKAHNALSIINEVHRKQNITKSIISQVPIAFKNRERRIHIRDLKTKVSQSRAALNQHRSSHKPSLLTPRTVKQPHSNKTDILDSPPEYDITPSYAAEPSVDTKHKNIEIVNEAINNYLDNIFNNLLNTSGPATASYDFYYIADMFPSELFEQLPGLNISKVALEHFLLKLHQLGALTNEDNTNNLYIRFVSQAGNPIKFPLNHNGWTLQNWIEYLERSLSQWDTLRGDIFTFLQNEFDSEFREGTPPLNLRDLERVEIIRYEQSKNKTNNGSFFRYTIKHPKLLKNRDLIKQLERYQIVPRFYENILAKKTDKIIGYKVNRILDESCLIYALRMSELFTEKELQSLKLMFNTRYVSTKSLHECLLNFEDVSVVINEIQKNGKKNKNYKHTIKVIDPEGNEYSRRINYCGCEPELSTRLIELYVYKQHYFLKEMTPYTPSKIHEILDYTPPKSIKLRYINTCLDSGSLVRYLMTISKHLETINQEVIFKPITLSDEQILSTTFFNDVDQNITSLEYNSKFSLKNLTSSDIQTYKYDRLLLTLDYESDTRHKALLKDPKADPRHIPYLVCTSVIGLVLNDYEENFVDQIYGDKIVKPTLALKHEKPKKQNSKNDLSKHIIKRKIDTKPKYMINEYGVLIEQKSSPYILHKELQAHKRKFTRIVRHIQNIDETRKFENLDYDPNDPHYYDCTGELILYLKNLADEYSMYDHTELDKQGNPTLVSRPMLIIFVHNLSYDMKFLKWHNCTIEDPIHDGNNFYSFNLRYKTMTEGSYVFCFRDYLKLNPNKLSKIPSMLDIQNIKKEIFPYNDYTMEALRDGYEYISNMGQYEFPPWTDEDKKLFNETVDIAKARCPDDPEMFDMYKYAEFYCLQDCNILKQAVIKLRDLILKAYQIDILDKLTISSVSYEHFKQSVGRLCEESDTIYKESLKTKNNTSDETSLDNASDVIKESTKHEPKLTKAQKKAQKRAEKLERSVLQIGGVVKLFCEKAIIGARTMTRLNCKYDIREKVTDVDCSALYPAAISRCSLQLGVPEVIKIPDSEPHDPCSPNSYGPYTSIPSYLKRNDHSSYKFIIELNITNVGKHYDFPLICQKNESGNHFNDLINVETGNPISPEHPLHFEAMDNIMLEDLIQFSHITFNIVRGYIWKGDTISLYDFMTKMHNKRDEYKKQGNNSLAQVAKLMENSIYGKMYEHAHTTQTVCLQDRDYAKYQKYVKDGDKLINIKNIKDLSEVNPKNIVIEGYNYNDYTSFITKNYHKVKRDIQFYDTDTHLVEVFSEINKSFNMSHLACDILSMSKRIMNEVMCLAQDLGCHIYYQDTDSMHIRVEDLKRLSTEYKRIYHKTLLGTSLGKFHSDFTTLIDDDGHEHEAAYSEASVFLMKKMYLDVLYYPTAPLIPSKAYTVEYKGDKVTCYAQDSQHTYHIRCKGVSLNALIHRCSNPILKDDGTPHWRPNDFLGMYRYLYNNPTGLDFDLAANTTRFKFNLDQRVESISTFVRHISTPYEIGPQYES